MVRRTFPRLSVFTIWRCCYFVVCFDRLTWNESVFSDTRGPAMKDEVSRLPFHKLVCNNQEVCFTWCWSSGRGLFWHLDQTGCRCYIFVQPEMRRDGAYWWRHTERSNFGWWRHVLRGFAFQIQTVTDGLVRVLCVRTSRGRRVHHVHHTAYTGLISMHTTWEKKLQFHVWQIKANLLYITSIIIITNKRLRGVCVCVCVGNGVGVTC